MTVFFGSWLGVLLGIGYAALIVHGLRTWWVAAITTPFVELRLHPLPIALGALSGGVAAWFTWSIRPEHGQGSTDGFAARFQ